MSAQCRARPRISIDDAAAAAATAPKPNVVGWREQQRLGPAQRAARRSRDPRTGEQDEPDKGWALGAVGRTEAAHAEAAGKRRRPSRALRCGRGGDIAPLRHTLHRTIYAFDRSLNREKSLHSTNNQIAKFMVHE